MRGALPCDVTGPARSTIAAPSDGKSSVLGGKSRSTSGKLERAPGGGGDDAEGGSGAGSGVGSGAGNEAAIGEAKRSDVAIGDADNDDDDIVDGATGDIIVAGGTGAGDSGVSAIADVASCEPTDGDNGDNVIPGGAVPTIVVGAVPEGDNGDNDIADPANGVCDVTEGDNGGSVMAGAARGKGAIGGIEPVGGGGNGEAASGEKTGSINAYGEGGAGADEGDGDASGASASGPRLTTGSSGSIVEARRVATRRAIPRGIVGSKRHAMPYARALLIMTVREGISIVMKSPRASGLSDEPGGEPMLCDEPRQARYASRSPLAISSGRKPLPWGIHAAWTWPSPMWKTMIPSSWSIP